MSQRKQMPAGDESPAPQENDVDSSTVYDYLLYGLSLPERALRSSSAAVGGALRESAALLVPQAFRNSQSYSVFVQQMLDFLAENVGGVEKDADEQSPTQVENYVARKAVGSFIDLASLATLHLSPLPVLAILGDVAYGSKTYLHELGDELKRQGVIDQDSTIDSAAQLLDAIGDASSTAAEVFDMPPLSVDGMKETVSQTTDAVTRLDPTKLIPQSEIKRLWTEMYAIAKEENVSVLDVSGAMSLYTLNKMDTVTRGALSTIQVTGNMFDKHILDHYSNSVDAIRNQGLYKVLAETSQPYIAAVWQNFSLEKTTITEDLISGRLIGKAWTGIRYWLSPGDEQGPEEVDAPSNRDV